MQPAHLSGALVALREFSRAASELDDGEWLDGTDPTDEGPA
jgi:hypothetical protein